MTATPDMNDGIVNDDDGIITDDDTGVVPTQTPMADTSAEKTVRLCAGDGWRSKKVKNTPPDPNGSAGCFVKRESL